MRATGILASRRLWALVTLGVSIRVYLAYAHVGNPTDLAALSHVREALADAPLSVYGMVNNPDAGIVGIREWPYPPAFFAWIGVAALAERGLDLAFHGTVQLLAIAADAVIAVALAAFLTVRGASSTRALAAAALVMLSASFIAISGEHGQIDSVAIAPALLALVAWETAGERRAWVAGALIGIGTAVKWVPLLMVAALIGSARNRNERVVLVGLALAIPAALLAPFAVADPDGVRAALGYSGVPGLGGISALVQPGLASIWLEGAAVEVNGATRFLLDHGALLTLIPVAAVAGVVLARRTEPVAAALTLWLALIVFIPSFVLQYAVWLLPFMIAAGYLGWALSAQLLLALPTAIAYGLIRPGDAAAELYLPPVIAAWLLAVIILGIRLTRTGGEAEAPAPRSAAVV